MAIRAAQRLILALDFPGDASRPDRPIGADDARRLVDLLDDVVSFVKIGWPLYMAGGHGLAREFARRGKRVFLDLKFGDIPETVRRVVEAARQEGVTFLTLNAAASALRAAAAARGDSGPRLLAVTLLTSMDAQDLAESGISWGVGEYVLRRAVAARDAGCDGVIASGLEAAEIRNATGRDFLIVVPGIRPGGTAPMDQKRTATAAAAIRAGADYLVVGRPITQAADPRAAAQAVLSEMQAAFDSL